MSVTIRISPSILSADFANLQRELSRIATADYAHIDVMDNHFVPNLTIGLPVVRAIAGATELPLDLHLMIEDADRWAVEFAAAGASSVTFHAEASRAPIRLARTLRDAGVRAGIALRPATAVEPYLDHLDEFDMILVMTVEPGFGGQGFLGSCLPKIRRTRSAIDASGRDIWLQVDGGVSRATVADVARAGADMLVAGSAVYSADDPADEIAELRRLAEAAIA